MPPLFGRAIRRRSRPVPPFPRQARDVGGLYWFGTTATSGPVTASPAGTETRRASRDGVARNDGGSYRPARPPPRPHGRRHGRSGGSSGHYDARADVTPPAAPHHRHCHTVQHGLARKSMPQVMEPHIGDVGLAANPPPERRFPAEGPVGKVRRGERPRNPGPGAAGDYPPPPDHGAGPSSGRSCRPPDLVRFADTLYFFC